MKPKLLTLAGLQSYRKEQRIHFDELCESGVFGIFGPTGSGKSTILDAITLALYGQVERAQNGTQGIINQAEDKLSVSFTFQLAHAGEQEQYRVERQFKRNGEVSVHQVVSRLVQINEDGEIVLADKSREVDRLVQELLGLTMADFTRAVVLPQGKFSEFLALKGKDRREMLQRLFHLEAYGYGLNQRLASRIKQNEMALSQLEAEQSGLGDASEKAVKEAEIRLKEAEAAQKKSREKWLAFDQLYDEAKQRRAWQMELENVHEQFNELLKQEPAVNELEQKLKLAHEASQLAPYLDQFDQAAGQLDRTEKQLQTMETTYISAKQALELAEQAHLAAAEQLEKEEHHLIIKSAQFREAVEWEKELLAMRADEASANEQVIKQKDAAEAIRNELNKLHQLYEKALQKQTLLKQEAAKLERTSAERQLIRQMNTDRQELSHVQAQRQKQAADAAKKSEALKRISARSEQLTSKFSEWFQGAVQFAQATAEHKHRIASLKTEADGIQGRSAALYEQQLAAKLAAELAEGKPCPVCGSTEHSHVHERLGSDTKTTSTVIEDSESLDQLQRKAAQLHIQMNEMSWKAASVSRELAERLNESTDAPDGILEAAATLLQPIETDPISFKDTNAIELIERFEQLQSEAKQLHDSWNELEERWHVWLNNGKQLEEEHRVWKSDYKMAEEMLEASAQQLTEWEQQEQRLLERWAVRYPDIEPERAAEILQQAEENETKLDELNKRLEASVPFIEQTESNMKALDLKLRDAEMQLIQAESDVRYLAEKCGELHERIRKRAGDKSASECLEQTEQQLNELRKLEKQKKADYDEKERLYKSSSEQYSAAKEAVRSARERYESAQNEWTSRLSASRFEQAENVRQAFISEQDQLKITEQVTQYKELLVKITQDRDRLKRQIGGRQLTEEEWQQTEEQWKAAKEEDELALQGKAKAERDREDVLKRHERWKQLESARKKEAALREQLNKLQRVFRGNAFVEFIAEEQLMQVSRDASARLGDLTRQRYAIEVDSAGGFLIRDNANGGVKRPVSSLSGGETFLTSLALALALSAQIQLRGKYPLEFFFLDEGFGTLDSDLLETVVTALERLHMDKLSVGVISHVPELRARLARRIIVHPASPGGEGSSVSIETI